MNARPLRTTNVPMTAQTTPTTTAAMSPRCMNPYASGSSSTSTGFTGPASGCSALTARPSEVRVVASSAALVEMPLAGGLLVVVVRVVDGRLAGGAGQDQDVPSVRLGQEALIENEVGRPLGDEASIQERRL